MIGSCISHFHLSYDQVWNEIPYTILIMLSASVPKYKPKENKKQGEEVNTDNPASIFEAIAKQSKNK